MKTILGIDLGVASLGYVLFQIDGKTGRNKVLWSGTRIFPEALEGKSEESKQTKNSIRRGKRLSRRQTNRKNLKKALIAQFLRDSGLLDQTSTPASGPNKRDPREPFLLREKGCTAQLSFSELGIVFRHIANHPAFAGSPKLSIEQQAQNTTKKTTEDREQDAKEKTALTLSETLRERDIKISSWLIGEDQFKNQPLNRQMVNDEFEAIWTKQAEFYPDLLTPELKKALKHIMFYRRPIFWRLKSLGKCRYAPDSPLMMRAEWDAQYFMMLQVLNNIRLNTENKRPLFPDEWQIIHDLMLTKPKVTFSDIRKSLSESWKENGTELSTTLNFETGADAKKDLPGHATEAMLCDVLGSYFLEHEHRDDIRQKIASLKWDIDYRTRKASFQNKVTKQNGTEVQIPKATRVEIRTKEEIDLKIEEFIQFCNTEWGLSEHNARKLAEAGLPGGWTRLSERVIRTILPDLKCPSDPDNPKSNDFATVLNKKGFELPSPGENLDRLPSHPAALPDARNPVVIRCLNEVRKVVNKLIGKFGKPDYIRIELARDVKLSGKAKEKALKIHKQRLAARKKAEIWLRENNWVINRYTILKHQLWTETNCQCLYSGKPISADALFGNNSEFQIEHINPYSRSLDDSLNNLTLCDSALNSAKGNRTPFEAFGHSDRWAGFEKRVKAAKLSKAKQRRLLSRSYADFSEDRAGRQLTDTAYAAQLARDFVARLYPAEEAMIWQKNKPPRVQVVNGKITSLLGQIWGMYKAFNTAFCSTADSTMKIRDDHRHHALDAAIIAMVDPQYMTLISQAYSQIRRQNIPYECRIHHLKKTVYLHKPWQDFTKDVIAALERIIVSYRVDAKITGALTDDSHLSLVRDRKTGKVIEGTFAKRIDLTKTGVTAGDISSICDNHVRNIVWAHVRQFDDSGFMPEHADDDRRHDKKKINAHIDKAIKKAFAEPAQLPKMPTRSDKHPPNPIRRVRIFVKQNQNLTILVNKKTGARALKGDNHHVALYRQPDGTYSSEVVSKIEAQRRVQKGEPVIAKTSVGNPLVTSWCKRDMFEHIAPDTGEVTYWRATIIGEQQTTLILHNYAGKNPGKQRKKAPTNHLMITNGYRKISVDPIGHIHKAR